MKTIKFITFIFHKNTDLILLQRTGVAFALSVKTMAADFLAQNSHPVTSLRTTKNAILSLHCAPTSRGIYYTAHNFFFNFLAQTPF